MATKQDILDAARELYSHDNLTLANNGAEIRFDDSTDTLNGYRVASAAEDSSIRTRAEGLAVQKNAEMFISAVKLEVKKRIFEIASANTQMNMTAARADGDLTTDQLAAYHKGRIWINEMQAKARDLIAAGDVNYTEDSKWPPCLQEVIDLTKYF